MPRLLPIRAEVELGQSESARLFLVLCWRVSLASPRLFCTVAKLSHRRLHRLIGIVLIQEHNIIHWSLVNGVELMLLLRELM